MKEKAMALRSFVESLSGRTDGHFGGGNRKIVIFQDKMKKFHKIKLWDFRLAKKYHPAVVKFAKEIGATETAWTHGSCCSPTSLSFVAKFPIADYAKIWEYLDEFKAIKEENGCGDIRREIAECFTVWLEEKYYFNFTEEEHDSITEEALEQ
jgi:hypothetical protein